MEGGTRPQLFLEGGGGGGTGVFQVCPSGSQEIKLHYSLKRHQTLILGIHIKNQLPYRKKNYKNYRYKKKEEEKEEISTILYRWQCWITKCSNIVVC